MRFSDRRRTPVMHFILLVTCLLLCGIIALQQNVISNQSYLIRLLSGDSSQLAALKLQNLSKSR
jgi:hypothetical protein